MSRARFSLEWGSEGKSFTVIPTAFNWDCVVSRHTPVKPSWATGSVVSRRAWMGLEEAFQAAAWKGSTRRTRAMHDLIMLLLNSMMSMSHLHVIWV
jgi:hypothetical protein